MVARKLYTLMDKDFCLRILRLMGSEISLGLILLSYGPHGKRYTLIQETCGLRNLRNNFHFVHRMMCGLERTLKDEVQQY
ncbi:hypothetical protein MtrunA17_Chr8g0379471 [Medicago truncatula]|uniref:Uncharacterized protein n=1 Tax=Medicago truncatula TaxID=3880 RepID=A0A396GNG2_MEDTR|nr:hypothetical protein MtrunA17_Chr8g0379471 [Medicago truncatula]